MEYKGILPEDIIVSSWSSKRKGSWATHADVGIKIVHLPSKIIVTCDSDRSQHKNRHLALMELSDKLTNHAAKDPQCEN